MSDRIILLVEDNANDEALTQRALKKANVINKVVVARDGAKALDYLFMKGDFAGRDDGDVAVPQALQMEIHLRSVHADVCDRVSFLHRRHRVQYIQRHPHGVERVRLRS